MEYQGQGHVPQRTLILVMWLVASGHMAWGQCWTETAELKMGTPHNQDYFGSAVSVYGDTAIVGAPGDDNANGENAGSARFFERDQGGPNSWGNMGTKISPNGNIGDQLGTSVAISGDTAVAGGIYAGPLGSGAVSVFERNLGGPDAWGESAFLTPSNPDFNEAFGASVAIDGDTFVAGAPWNDSFAPSQGVAYVFERDWGGPGMWGEVAQLLPSDGSGGLFGGVAIFEDTLVVSAVNNNGATGAVYIFERDLGGPSAWGERIKLTASDGSSGDSFGASISLFGDTLLVGAYRDDGNGSDSGSAYVFERNLGGPNVWGEQRKIIASDEVTNAWFGAGVALFGDIAIVTATGEGAYVFERSLGGPPGWGELVKLELQSTALATSLHEATALLGEYGFAEGTAWVFDRNSDAVRYCTPGTSASGCQAILTACGTPSATAPSGFTLAVEDLEGSSHGLFFFGSNGRQANPWGNGTSFQCVVPPAHRAGTLKGVGTPNACDGLFGQDLNARWCPTCPKPNHNPGAGALVQAQLWYRDKASTSNQTTSLSDAVEFVVGP